MKRKKGKASRVNNTICYLSLDLWALHDTINVGGKAYVFLMDLNKKLQVLTGRAWALHDEISEEILGSHDMIKLCRFCSQHGHYCGVTDHQTPPLDREGLIAIRDSLKDVETMLLFLQRMNSWQQRDWSAAMSRLEASRIVLMENVAEYHGDTAVDVIKELNSHFSDVRTTAHNWNLKKMIEEMTEVPTSRKATSNFTMNCVRILINPWNWLKTARVALKLLVVSASISCTVKLCRTREGQKGFLLSASQRPLDVLHGRG